MSGWFLLMLVVCGAVRAQVPPDGNEDSQLLNPEKTTEEDLRVLVQDLLARVAKLEKECEDRGQCAGLSYTLTDTTLSVQSAVQS